MSVCFIGNGIALGVYLSQGILYGVVHLQFEELDVVLGLDDHIGSTQNALHLSVHLAVEQ